MKYLQTDGDVIMEYFEALPEGQSPENIVSVSGAGDWYVRQPLSSFCVGYHSFLIF